MKKDKKSSSRKPFSAFQEIQINPTITSDPLEGSEWSSKPCSAYQVSWNDFLADAYLPGDAAIQAFAMPLKDSTMPLVSGLTAIASNTFVFQRRLATIPTLDEVADQLAAMHHAAEKLASLAQGNDGRTPPASTSPWLVSDSSGTDGSEPEPAASHRSPFLHPMLQDHIEISLADVVRRAEGTENYEAALKELETAQANLSHFFEQLPLILDRLKAAENHVKALPEILHRTRKKGAPGDEALDWLLVRLMWIWRDVLGQELKIYLRKVRDRLSLSVPEPQGCMEFIVFVLSKVDPVQPHQLNALERRLIDLKSRVPVITLAVERRRS